MIGEVSDFKRPSSGHWYFTIKDAGASLRCVMWKNAASRQEFVPREGDAVEVHGGVSVFEPGGVYQLYADQIRPTGEGVLYQEFLRLKKRLEAEGLFEPERKREIPRWPHRIGIVTSPTGAALRDILHTLRRRFPLVEVVLASTPVQGVEAPPGVVQAIRELCRVACPDVILVARGGGSIEDLWAFNDERVARAIAACPVPVISGVGHETDFTIADFVADLRAPTPTAAAELATPNLLDLKSDLDERTQQLLRSTQMALETPHWQLNDLQTRLLIHSPKARLRSGQQRLDEISRRSAIALAHGLQMRRTRLSSLEQRLQALNPSAVLNRGYAMIINRKDKLVHSVKQVHPGEHLDVRLSDGQFGAQVEENK